MTERTYAVFYDNPPRRVTLDQLKTLSIYRLCHPEAMGRFIGVSDFCQDHGYDFGFGSTIRTVAGANNGFLDTHFIVATWGESDKCVGSPSNPYLGHFWAKKPGVIHKQTGDPPNSWHIPLDGDDTPEDQEEDTCVALDAIGGSRVYRFAGAICHNFGVKWLGLSDEPHFQMQVKAGPDGLGPDIFPAARHGKVFAPSFVFPTWPLPNYTPPTPTPPSEALVRTLANIIDDKTLQKLDAQFTGPADADGGVWEWSWTGPGSDPQAKARAAGCTRVVTLPLSWLANTDLIGPKPVGDRFHTWVGAGPGGEFYRHIPDTVP